MGLTHTASRGLQSRQHHIPAQIMITRINNAICLLVVAAVFAMIGIEAGNQPGMTHSGTQQEVRK